jgi:hypothetical protein
MMPDVIEELFLSYFSLHRNLFHYSQGKVKLATPEMPLTTLFLPLRRK